MVLPALLIACAAAHAVTVLLMRRSILTEKVARRGHHVVREYIVNPLARLRVEDAMERDVPVLPAEATIETVGQWLAGRDPRMGHRYAWPLVDRAGALVGLLTRGDLMKALERAGEEDSTVRDAGASELVGTYPTRCSRKPWPRWRAITSGGFRWSIAMSRPGCSATSAARRSPRRGAK